MKKINVSVLVIALAMATTACNNAAEGTHNEAGHEMHEHEGHEHSGDMEDHEADVETTMAKTSLDAAMVTSITTDYLAVKDALVNDDAEGAKAAAAKMQSVLTGTEDELGKKLHFDAEHISGTNEIGHQRDHFEVLTKNVVALNTQVKTGQDLYIQHCPMAFDGKGADWVSNSKDVYNPYFGEKMLKCGRVQKKI